MPAGIGQKPAESPPILPRPSFGVGNLPIWQGWEGAEIGRVIALLSFEYDAQMMGRVLLSRDMTSFIGNPTTVVSSPVTVMGQWSS